MAKPSTAVDCNVILMRELLRKKGLAIKDAAAEIGVTREYLNRIVLGLTPCTAKNLQKIAKPVEVSLQLDDKGSI